MIAYAGTKESAARYTTTSLKVQLCVPCLSFCRLACGLASTAARFFFFSFLVCPGAETRSAALLD